MSTAAILVVIQALGFGHTWLAVWILPLGFLVGLCFGAFGLVMNALAPGYDFFTYFFTLVLTPMLLFSGVYFPVAQMPPWLADIASVLPLSHAIDIARPLMLDRIPANITSSSAIGALMIASQVRCTCIRENAEYMPSKLDVNIALWHTMPVPMNATYDMPSTSPIIDPIPYPSASMYRSGSAMLPSTLAMASLRQTSRLRRHTGTKRVDGRGSLVIDEMFIA
jgi:hypothetical protein